MTDHFEFNFGKPTPASNNGELDNVVEFPFFPRNSATKPAVFVLSQKYRVPDHKAVENG